MNRRRTTRRAFAEISFRFHVKHWRGSTVGVCRHLLARWSDRINLSRLPRHAARSVAAAHASISAHLRPLIPLMARKA